MALTIVSGKGGVGKTRFSVLLKKKHPDSLITERGENLQEEALKLGMPSIGGLLPIRQRELLEEFLVSVLKLNRLAKWASGSKLLQNVVHLAPNLDELLLLHRWLSVSKTKDLIVDAPSTGNLISILSAVGTAHQMFDGGSLKKVAWEIKEALDKGEGIHIYLVSIPENSALEEMKELEDYLSNNFPNLKVSKVINRLHEMPDESLKIPEALKELAYQRPADEAERIKAIPFEIRVREGATELA